MFLAYFGAFGRDSMVRDSVAVRITLFLNVGSLKGSMSAWVPHLAEPYSLPCLNFFAFFALMYIMSLNAPPISAPIRRSKGSRLGITS